MNELFITNSLALFSSYSLTFPFTPCLNHKSPCQTPGLSCKIIISIAGALRIQAVRPFAE